MKSNKMLWSFARLCAIAATTVWILPARAQAPAVKEKPPQYSYASFWTIPRAQWPEMAKVDAADKAIMDKAVANGTIIGYGNEASVVHRVDGDTHADWWSSMSMGGLLNVLAQLRSSESATSPALQSATKHWDEVIVARYYDWRPGTWQGVYTYAGFYSLKATAPDNAVELLSKNLVAPLLAKLFADGTIVQYEIDTEAVQTEAPGRFWIFCVAKNADAIDTINAAVRGAMKSNPLGATAFDSIVDFNEHRDYIALASATYK
jgi:hypothetical protein